jgi:hypothetical protein
MMMVAMVQLVALFSAVVLLGLPLRAAAQCAAGSYLPLPHWEHSSPGCVSGHNIEMHRGIATVAQCEAICRATAGCVAFEYGVPHGGSGAGAGYRTHDCQPQSATNPAGCDGFTYNLDLYVLTAAATADQSSCSACAAGQYQGSTGQSSCTACAAGRVTRQYHGSTGQSSCTACATGRYVGSTGQSSCIACAAGRYVDVTGSDDVSDCSACAAGRYQGSTGQSSCTACAAGRYQGSTGQSSCIACAAGQYVDVTGSDDVSDCSACAAGRYQGSTGQSSCIACAAGQYQGGRGGSSCTGCAAGEYAPSGAASCSACAAGTYITVTGSDADAVTDCISCGAGWFGTATGETTPVSACPYNACPAGTFSPMASGACATCGAGSFTASSVQDSDGSGVRTGGTHCNLCPAGTFNSAGDDACDTCVAGHYTATASAEVTEGCVPIAGTIPEEQSTTTTCALTAAVAAVVAVAESCTGSAMDGVSACDLDVSSDGSAACPVGCTHEAPAQGVTGVSGSCAVATGFGTCSYVPPVGRVETGVTLGASLCSRCPVGRFNEAGDSFCDGQCPAGKYSTATGSTSVASCIACASATYQPMEGQSTCTNCPAGLFAASSDADNTGDSVASGASHCNSCPPAKFRGGSNDIDCVICPAGHFTTTFEMDTDGDGVVTVATHCVACPTGKSNAQGDATCDDCTAGLYTSSVGTVTCDACADGHFTTTTSSDVDGMGVITGASHCVACPTGKANVPGDATCDDCTAGLYTSSVGTATCDACADGHFTATTSSDADGMGVITGASHCVACPTGKANVPGDDTCDDCTAGLYTSSVGTVTCDICADGHFTATTSSDVDGMGVITGASHCVACPMGKANVPGDDTCDDCTAGLYTSSVGTATCGACADGHFTTTTSSDADGMGVITGATHCNLCGLGRYNQPGDASCDGECPAGTFGEVMGAASASNCTGCPSGQYGTQWGADNSLVCTSCAAGQFTANSGSDVDGVGVSTGATHCNSCPTGRYNQHSDGVCDQCPAGKYSASIGASDGTACNDCASGKYGTVTGATTAQAACPYDTCPAGTASDGGAGCLSTFACDDSTATIDVNRDHLNLVSNCVGTVETRRCAHACHSGFEGGSVTCLAGSGPRNGAFVIVPCAMCTPVTNAASVTCTDSTDSVPVTADAGYYVALGVVETCTPVTNAASVTCSAVDDSVPVTADTGYYVALGVVETCTVVANALSVTCTDSTASVVATCDANYDLTAGACVLSQAACSTIVCADGWIADSTATAALCASSPCVNTGADNTLCCNACTSQTGCATGVSAGAIVGIIVAVLVVVLILAFVFCKTEAKLQLTNLVVAAPVQSSGAQPHHAVPSAPRAADVETRPLVDAVDVEVGVPPAEIPEIAVLLPPVPDSPVSGCTFAASNFKAAYTKAGVPEGPIEIGDILSVLIRAYCMTEGIAWREEGQPFFKLLQKEAMTNAQELVGEIPQAAQRMWTSALRLRGREFCYILNAAVRSDRDELADSIAGLSRAINLLCVTTGPSALQVASHPPDNVCYRGGGFDDRYRSFFVSGRQFRQPAYLATSFSRAVATDFLSRSDMPSKVLWMVRIDPHRKCVHVNLVKRSNVPGEEEYLFAPYSAFTVVRVRWNAGSTHSPHEIELLAAVDNKEAPEDLSLAPWS